MPTFRSNNFTPVPNGGAQYRLAIAVTVASQDVTANTSRVDWYMVIEKDRSYRGFYEYTAHHSVTIDGSVVHNQTNASPNAEWPGWSQHLLASGTSIITHNADGTRNLSVSGAWERSALGWSPGSMYVSGSFALPTIARATQPKVTPGTAAVGATVKIDLPRASGSFTHDVTWKSGTLSGTVGTGIATTANFVVPSVMGEFPGQTRAPITFTAVTKNGATTIGSKSVTLQATNPPPAPAIRELKPGQEFDIRARLVEWDAASSEWRRGKILPTISLSMVDPASSTTTCSLTMSKRSAVDFDDHSIIDIDVFDGENWRFTNHRFVLSRIEGDDVDPSETFTYSGTEYVDYILGFAYIQSDVHWDGGQNHWGPTSPGDMLKYSTTLAKQRGWGTRFDTAFDMNKTTFGDPWTNRTVNRVLSAGTPISQVLDGLVTDGYAEYQTEYHSNKAWLVLLNPGTGTSFADVGASPIVNLSLAKLSRAPRRGTSEKRITRVTVVGDTAEGGNSRVRSTREKTPFNSNVFGHMEGWVSASGVKDSGEVAKIGDNALRDNSSVVNERTFEYDAQDASPQFFPYVVFRPGDWILTPGNDAPVSDRISQITISKSEDSKSITILTGDRILSGQASLAKRQAAQTGGAIAGGTGMSPAPIDSRIPAQPVIDTVTSVGYWTTDGTARSEITVKWAPVTDSLSGSPISTDLYEVWWREAVGGVWKFRAATSETEIDMPDWEVLKNYELRVRARSTAGIFGEFSENIEHTTPEPAVDLDGPILSDLYTDGLGNVYASWDGTLGGVPAPNRVGYIAAEVSSDGGTVYAQMGTPITAMGTIVIAPGSYGEFKVRLRAFDGLGNPGDASLPQTITTENPHINEVITLSSTTQALVSPSGGGATTPATAVITGTATNTTITSWEYAVDGGAFAATVPAGVSRNVNVVTITGATMTAKTIAVRASDTHGASDTLTIAKLANGTNGTNGAPGTGISSSTVTYQASASGTTAPTGTWNSTVPSVPAGQFLWTRTVIAFTDGGSTTTYSVARMGTNGTNGVSVTGAVVTYQTSASGTTEPTGAWSGTVPSVPAGQFLWTRTVTSYSNSTSTTSYAVSYAGTNGANGAPSYFHVAYATNSTGTAGFSTTDPTGKTYVGTYSDSTAADSTDPAMYDWMLVKGADGATGNGITSSTVTYQTSASGTTTPTGTWNSAVPSVTAGQFLWTRTVLTFSDGGTTTSYAVSRAGTNGTNGTNGVSVTGAVVTYQASASGTTTPTGTWNSSVPSVPAGQFLWTRTVTSYSNSTSTTSYSVGSAGTNGANGQTSYIHVAYATNSTGTAGFSTTDPAGKTYLGTYTDFVAADSTDPTKYLWSLIKGTDGAAAYTVILSNESHTFPGTASAAVAGSTTSRVFAYKGATASAATVGTITGAPTGMTTSVSGNGTTAPIITINVATTLVTQSGVLTVPITVDGVSFSKTISWSVARSLVGAKVPISPTALTATPGAGWDESGSFPTAWFDVAWTAPTLDTEGAPVAIAGYDLWGKKTSDPEMRFITSVAAPQTRVAVGDGEEWSFQVLAVSSTGGKSELTAAITVVANATTPAAPAPGVPSLDQYAGLLRILWSGAGMLPQIKTVYATIASSAAGPYTRAGMPLTGAGEVVVPGLAPGQYWAKIVMVDERGAISTSAAAGPITLLPITGVTIQTSPVANTGIKITDAALTAYDVSGNPTFIVDATTGSVWIAPYDAVFEFGATGIVAETGTATTGVQISSENSSFNTFIHAAGVQIRNDQTPLSWWEADASDASLVNFVAPRARVDDRFRIGDYEFLREAKAGNKSRLVIRYRGA